MNENAVRDACLMSSSNYCNGRSVSGRAAVTHLLACYSRRETTAAQHNDDRYEWTTETGHQHSTTHTGSFRPWAMGAPPHGFALDYTPTYSQYVYTVRPCQ